MFSCCPQFPHHVECFARIAVEDNGAIFCPRCPAGRRDHVDAGWFQRLCCINGVDWPSPQSDCVLCADLLGDDRISVPCCHQEVHVSCLAQSFNACGAHCPFCVQPLREFVESSAFQAAAVFHGYYVNPADQPSNRGVNSMVVPTGFPQPLDTVTLLCCAHTGPPPLFEQTSDRRMEWSPVWQPSSSSWLHQWLCVSCSRTVQTSETGDIHQLPCAQCGVLSHMVIDCSSGERLAMVPTMSMSHRPSCKPKSQLVFSRASCECRSVVWVGRRANHLTRSGPTVLAFLPSHLIGIVAALERGRGVPVWSTGSRHRVPEVQEQFWMSCAISGSSPDTCNLCLLNQSLHRFCRTLLHGLAENISLVQYKRCAFQPTCLSLWKSG